jgi:hypothetical protein
MDISDLLGAGTDLDVVVGDDEEAVIKLQYNAAALTPAFIQNISQHAKRALSLEKAKSKGKGKSNDEAVIDELELGAANIDTLVEGLAAVLISWDVTAKGEPVGTDADSLRNIPSSIIQVVWAAIQANVKGQDEEDEEGNA